LCEAKVSSASPHDPFYWLCLVSVSRTEFFLIFYGYEVTVAGAIWTFPQYWNLSVILFNSLTRCVHNPWLGSAKLLRKFFLLSLTLQLSNSIDLVYTTRIIGRVSTWNYIQFYVWCMKNGQTLEPFLTVV